MSTETPTARRPGLGVLVLVVCATMWSISGPLIKTLANDGVAGITIAYYRSLLGGLVLVPFALRRRQALRRVRIGWPIASVALFTVMTACFVISTAKTASANAVILQYTSPMWVFALSPLLLKERPGLTEGLVLLIAMAGVGIIFFGHPAAESRWLLVALASGFGYGALTVVLRGLRAVNPLVVACMNCVGSSVLLLPAVLLWGSFKLTGYQFVLMFVLSFVQFTLPYVLFSWALQRVEAHRAALIVLLETVLNPLFTWLVVRETVPTPTLAGSPLIVAGIVGWILLVWRRKRSSLQPSVGADHEPSG
ncbi:MAG: DMT family transporter [Planctomycetes bacterium]|nr:DMT family transporter [Planctomycetota bacterium]